jgi:hypothetical protein
MNADGGAKDDVKVPEGDLGKEIQSGFDEGKDLLVTIISAMNEEQVGFRHSSPSFSLTVLLIVALQAISFKEAPKGN